MWVGRIDRKIAAVQQRQAEEERARRLRPAPPDWVAFFGGDFEALPRALDPNVKLTVDTPDGVVVTLGSTKVAAGARMFSGEVARHRPVLLNGVPGHMSWRPDGPSSPSSPSPSSKPGSLPSTSSSTRSNSRRSNCPPLPELVSSEPPHKGAGPGKRAQDATRSKMRRGPPRTHGAAGCPSWPPHPAHHRPFGRPQDLSVRGVEARRRLWFLGGAAHRPKSVLRPPEERTEHPSSPARISSRWTVRPSGPGGTARGCTASGRRPGRTRRDGGAAATSSPRAHATA
ncbi:hypothetical protein SUDANB25_05787 [Streptomyces sp. SudanB25_2051]